MPPRDPKQEPLASRLASKSKPPSPPRRPKLKPVIYKSSALNRAAPSLVAAADPTLINKTVAIQQANAEAERIRDAFKLEKCGPEVDVGEGDDETTNAKKYERRLLMNRHSAAASRVRREAYTKALEAQLVQYEAMLTQVNALLEVEREKNKHLKEETGHDGSEDDDDNDDDEGDDHHSELEDIGFDAASSAGLVLPPAPVQAPMESQTDDNNDTSAAPTENPMQLPPPSSSQASLAQIPPPQQAYFASLKTEDLLMGDPLSTDVLQSMVSNDKLLECFLGTDDAVAAEARLDNVLNFS